MRLFGLIGYPLSHSFSKRYFTDKFQREGIENCRYELFPLKDISEIKQLLRNEAELVGLNVTIPYKESVMPFLDELGESAERVGAVNTIKIVDNKLIGYNTDVYGFQQSLKDFLGRSSEKNEANFSDIEALVLGTGGASKAVAYAVDKLGIPFKMVSRSMTKGELTYKDLDKTVIKQHRLIINTTPLGMSPKNDTFPKLNYKALTKHHFLFDLVYNPEITAFLKKGKDRGAETVNGLQMLQLQAEKSWQIWNEVTNQLPTV